MSEVVVRPRGKVLPPLSGACTMEAVVMDRAGGHDGADCPGESAQTGCTRRKELLIRSPVACESPSATSALRVYSYKELGLRRFAGGGLPSISAITPIAHNCGFPLENDGG